MAFQLPNFQALPVAVIANPADRTRAEIVAYRALVPQHGYAVPYPHDPPVTADQATRLACLQDIRQYVNGLFPIYAARYAALAQVIATGNQPGPAVAAPRPPKTALPRWHDISFNNAVICPFSSSNQEIRWMLQLMEGEASHRRDEQLVQYELVPQPAHLGDRALFVVEFRARWTDPYKSEKALDKILKGHVVQRTSVKSHNDQFNEALSLTTQTGADAASLRSYETGLKPTVRNAAVVALIANPNINFHDRQMLMVRPDETFMQTRAQTNPTTQRRYVSNNPIVNPPSGQSAHGTPTPTPVTHSVPRLRRTRT